MNLASRTKEKAPTSLLDKWSSFPGEGLIVESASWWDSAEALDHQIALAIDIAHRLTELQRLTQ